MDKFMAFSSNDCWDSEEDSAAYQRLLDEPIGGLSIVPMVKTVNFAFI
jgi:hypothetical protein